MDMLARRPQDEQQLAELEKLRRLIRALNATAPGALAGTTQAPGN
jgi:hypothetical protein